MGWTAFLGHSPKRQVSPNDDIITTLFCSPNHREPPHDTYPEVECYINKCLNDICNLKFKPSKKINLTHDETAGLFNLQKRDDIVIRPADKGGTVGVWDRQLYIGEAYKQLDNSTNYLKLSKTTLLINQKEYQKRWMILYRLVHYLPQPHCTYYPRSTSSTTLVNLFCQHAVVPLNTYLHTLILCYNQLCSHYQPM